jgi:hypothetical protein
MKNSPGAQLLAGRISMLSSACALPIERMR